MKDSFVFYRSFIEAFKELEADDFKEAVIAMCDYALDDNEPEASGIVKAIFTLTKPVIDANKKRYENGCKGGRPKTKTAEECHNQIHAKDNQDITKQNQDITKQNQDITNTEPYEDVDVDVYVDIKEKSVSKDTPKEKSRKRFSPPSLDQVKEYCLERKNNVNAEAFVDFYTAKGWKVGREGMKDWKAAVRTWEKRETARSGTTNKFNAFEQRQNDMAAIEEKMFRRRAAL